MPALIEQTQRGLYCEAGDFFIDPWQPVDRAVITHAHSDHARPGSRTYLAAESGVTVLRERLGSNANIEGIAFGAVRDINGVRVSLHPAGHVLGSAQVRLEHRGEVWVASGDYKICPDCTGETFEPLPCDTFLTESTFGLPIYRWQSEAEIYAHINDWWRSNQDVGRTSVIFAYALGKAQRVLAGIDGSIGPIFAHGAVDRFVRAYRAAGVKLPEVQRVDDAFDKSSRGRAFVIAPPSAASTPWMRRFGESSTAFVSGWMQIRGNRRRAHVDRGFSLSDHADWDGLIQTIRATGAPNIIVTHGYAEIVARWLNENGWHARVCATRFSNQGEEALRDEDT